MFYIRFLHFSFLFILMLLDLLLDAFIGQILPAPFVFVPKLTFIGLVLLMQNENIEKTLLKGVLLAIWMDLNHLDSFPIFLISYIVTLSILSYWKRHISTNLIEFGTISIVAMFIQESLAFMIAQKVYALKMTAPYFLAYRMFWVVMVNILFIPLVLNLYKRIHHAILSKTQDLSGY